MKAFRKDSVLKTSTCATRKRSDSESQNGFHFNTTVPFSQGTAIDRFKGTTSDHWAKVEVFLNFTDEKGRGNVDLLINKHQHVKVG